MCVKNNMSEAEKMYYVDIALQKVQIPVHYAIVLGSGIPTRACRKLSLNAFMVDFVKSRPDSAFSAGYVTEYAIANWRSTMGEKATPSSAAEALRSAISQGHLQTIKPEERLEYHRRAATQSELDLQPSPDDGSLFLIINSPSGDSDAIRALATEFADRGFLVHLAMTEQVKPS